MMDQPVRKSMMSDEKIFIHFKSTSRNQYMSLATDSRAVILLFSEVKDASKLPPASCGAIVDLAFVVSYLHLESALFRVQFNRHKRGSMHDEAISSNIYYSLSSSKKMSETQKKYSISATTTHVAYLMIDPSDDYLHTLKTSILDQDLAVEVSSDAASLFVNSLLTQQKATELAAVFKISPHELKVGTLEEAVLMKIAVKESV